MAKYLIDSDIIIWFLRGKREIVKLVEELQRSGIPACSPISIIEVQLGVREKEQKITSDFLNSLEVYPIEGEIANHTGNLIREYKKKGISVKLTDAVVVTTCLLNNLTLVTYNIKHYPFRELKIYPI